MPNKCILCENKEKEFVCFSKFADHEFRIVKCLKCGLLYIFISDRNLNRILKEYYQKKYYERRDFQENTEFKLFIELRSKIAKLLKIFYCEQDSQKKFLKRNRITAQHKILDLGCGRGQFLTWLDHNKYSVIGIEPDSDSVKIAQKYLRNGKVRIGFIEQINKINESADVVCMLHVLEHLVRPDIILKNLKKQFPKSKLFIEVPNCGNRNAFKVSLKTAHNYHFNLNTIKTLLENAGWKILTLETPARRRGYFSQLLWLLFGKDVCPVVENGWGIRVLAK